MMAPMLEELKKEYAGRLRVEFIDIGDFPEAAEKYRIRVMPTQIFLDGSGKELCRHEGFYSKEDILGKWRELGYDFSSSEDAGFSRLEPVAADSRPRERVCYMCDGSINPQTRVTVKSDEGDVYLCSPHCYFITYSSLLDKQGLDEKTLVADWPTEQPLAAAKAVYLCGTDDSGRPAVKAFADEETALGERRVSGGNILSWERLGHKELANRCGFCDRAVYPEDAAVVRAGGLHTWGCCPMCALGVAARTGQDIEVFEKDALTGEAVHVKTAGGSVSVLEPETAVAWAGKKKGSAGKLVSTGCFKQAFFSDEENLRKWVAQHPTATGKMVSISEALAAKMKLSPEQINGACKIGECKPK
jgi:thiol-disulfide isomerase/thioredoxin